MLSRLRIYVLSSAGLLCTAAQAADLLDAWQAARRYDAGLMASHATLRPHRCAARRAIAAIACGGRTLSQSGPSASKEQQCAQEIRAMAAELSALPACG